MMLLACFFLAQLAHAEIVVEPSPVVGGEVVIHVIDDLSRPVSGATVRVVSRPGLPGEREVPAGLTDPRGRVYWTPDKGGPHRLRAGRHETLVHVGHEGVDATPAIILGVSLFLAFIALLWGLWPTRRPDPQTGWPA